MTGWASKALPILLLAAAAPALAQPVQLVPLPRGQREVPAIVQPAAAPPAEAEPASKPDSGPIEVSPLRLPDPSSAGTLTGSAGYGDELWKGSSRRLVERLTALLPANERSAAVREVARRLLLTGGPLPEGRPEAKSLLGLRVERLAAMGMAEAAVDLAQLAPPSLNDPKLARSEADAWLMLNDSKRACALQQTWVREDSDPFWVKLGFFCRIGSDDAGGGALVLALVREQGIDDPGFLALGDILTGVRGARLDGLPQPSPLHVALLRAAKRAPPADAWAGAAPAVLPSLLDTGLGDPDLRLAAAERAAAAGTLPPAALAKAYGAVAFSAEDKRDVPGAVKKLAGNPARVTALLYQSAAAQAVHVAQAELLRRLAAQAAERGLLEPVARAAQPIVAALIPSEELGFATGAVIRLALAAGDGRTAQQWYRWAAVRSIEQDKPAAEGARSVWRLALLAGIETGGLQAAAWQVWLDTQGELAGTERQRRGAALLLLADALGMPPPPELLVDSLGAEGDANTRPAPPLALRGMEMAAADGRRGEVLLYALMALGGRGPATLDIGSTAAIVAALRKVGLDGDARQIALDAALARSF
jgi:hypothetical protein